MFPFLSLPFGNLNFSQLNLIFNIIIWVLGIWKLVKMSDNIHYSQVGQTYSGTDSIRVRLRQLLCYTTLWKCFQSKTFFQLLSNNWHVPLCKLRGTTSFDTCMYCEMTVEMLANIHQLTAPTVFPCDENFKIYSLSKNFQIYETVFF